MVILEHQYQASNPSNQQKRYVIIPTWEQYKVYIIDKMSGRYFKIIEETVGELKAEFKYKALKATYIHEATVVREKGLYLNGSIFLIDGGEDEYIQEK